MSRSEVTAEAADAPGSTSASGLVEESVGKNDAGSTPPALSGRIWGVLLWNEWFKTRKRVAFWLGLGFFVFITFMNHGQGFFEGEADFRLPEIWGDVFSGDSVILLIFAGISLVMLASTEFTWRTARQNVIDGLSKTQWFWGKAMLLPIVGLAFVGSKVLIPAVLGLIRTDFATASGPLFPLSAVQATGGLFLAFLCLGSLGLFLSLAIRNTGGAMGVWFLWILPVEQLILPGLVGQLLPDFGSWLQYLPFTGAQRLLNFASYDTPTYERMVAAALEAERSVPELQALAPSMISCAVWTMLFVGVSFVWFRRRDL